MEKNNLLIKGSFRGIASDFTKYILILLASIILYAVCSNIKNQYYSAYNIHSFFTFATQIENVKETAILSLLFLLFLILIIVCISIFFKLIGLLYELGKSISIDAANGKIICTTYSFPLSKNIDENKFDDIISVNITQSFMDRIYSSGNLYLEFVACTKVDSQLRNIEIKNVSYPLKIKQKLI